MRLLSKRCALPSNKGRVKSPYPAECDVGVSWSTCKTAPPFAPEHLHEHDFGLE